jgi:hypothetical protein
MFPHDVVDHDTQRSRDAQQHLRLRAADPPFDPGQMGRGDAGQGREPVQSVAEALAAPPDECSVRLHMRNGMGNERRNARSPQPVAVRVRRVVMWISRKVDFSYDPPSGMLLRIVVQ